MTHLWLEYLGDWYLMVPNFIHHKSETLPSQTWTHLLTLKVAIMISNHTEQCNNWIIYLTIRNSIDDDNVTSEFMIVIFVHAYSPPFSNLDTSPESHPQSLDYDN